MARRARVQRIGGDTARGLAAACYMIGVSDDDDVAAFDTSAAGAAPRAYTWVDRFFGFDRDDYDPESDEFGLPPADSEPPADNERHDRISSGPPLENGSPAEPSTTPGSRGSDAEADMSTELAETRSPTERIPAAFAETSGAGGRSSGALPETRSPTEPISATAAQTGGTESLPPAEPGRTRSPDESLSASPAEVGGAEAHSTGSIAELRSLDEPSFTANAAIDGPSARIPGDDPENRSLAELFFQPTSDHGTSDAATTATRTDDRSLSEPSSAGIPPEPSTRRRCEEEDEKEEERRDRDERADDIEYLLTRWELGTVHRLHALAAHHDLDVREFLVLSELVIRPAGLTASQLTGIVGGGAARMSVLVRGLEKRGLVERDPDPFDKRSILVGATDRAREFLLHRPASRLRSYVRQEFSSEERAATVTHFVDIASTIAYGSARLLRDGRGLV